jgi:hypothetical protein
MKLRSTLLGIVTVFTLATPGFAQDAPKSTSTVIAQQSVTPPTVAQNIPAVKKKWEYYVASFYYKSGKSGFFGIGSTKSEWIFELDNKKASLREGLAELGNLGYELVGIDPSSPSGHENTLYIFKREVVTP